MRSQLSPKLVLRYKPSSAPATSVPGTLSLRDRAWMLRPRSCGAATSFFRRCGSPRSRRRSGHVPSRYVDVARARGVKDNVLRHQLMAHAQMHEVMPVPPAVQSDSKMAPAGAPSSMRLGSGDRGQGAGVAAPWADGCPLAEAGSVASSRIVRQRNQRKRRINMY